MGREAQDGASRGYLKGGSVLIFNHQKQPGVRIDDETVRSLHEALGSKGANLLEKYLQWVYVPAVKDASTEQEESSKTALGQLLERTIRTKVSFREPIDKLKRRLEDEYRGIIRAVSSSVRLALAARSGSCRCEEAFSSFDSP